MSNELIYRSLAAVSIAKTHDQSGELLGGARTSDGRQYATIHRSNPLMPQSLRREQEQQPILAPLTLAPIDVFVIPKMLS